MLKNLSATCVGPNKWIARAVFRGRKVTCGFYGLLEDGFHDGIPNWLFGQRFESHGEALEGLRAMVARTLHQEAEDKEVIDWAFAQAKAA